MQRKRYSTVRVLGLCLFAALVSSLALRAQDVTASINGVVSDPTGATVAAARVTAEDLDRGTILSTVTDRANHFYVHLLDEFLGLANSYRVSWFVWDI